MSRSIFWRLVVSQVLIAILAVAAAGMLSYRLFRDHYITAEERELKRVGRAVAELASPLLAEEGLGRDVSTVARTAGALVDGRVCIFGSQEHALLAASGDGEGDELSDAALRSVLSGEVHFERTSAKCEPRQLFKVTVPINSAGGPMGSVMVRAPVEGTESILRNVRRLSLGTALWVGIGALLLSLLLARTITSPLRRITDASARIGEGNLDTRVDPLPSGEIGELATTINEMAERLERMEEMRRSFVANASHQLRTPLTGARGFVEALADGTASTPEARQRCATVALAEMGRMQVLIEKLMDLSRYDAGAVTLEPELAPVDGLVQGALTAFETRAAEMGVSLVTDVEPGLPAVAVDGARVVEALGNLIDNALRVTPSGGAVTVGVARAGDAARLSVADEGPGVSAEDRDAVWDRFFSRRRVGEAGGGMGLGLAIVSEIAHAHGGEVFLEDAPEGGAVFGLTLPISGPS
ncbi:MAG TPA: HAMP domain-containing sensor histidine kinase [Armatimonadota bacterium]|jgi:signal transduction histidine kinase|nr:HAMP domain-containing sensor histidine kinase [Armatimonadota bacterium]